MKTQTTGPAWSPSRSRSLTPCRRSRAPRPVPSGTGRGTTSATSVR